MNKNIVLLIVFLFIAGVLFLFYKQSVTSTPDTVGARTTRTSQTDPWYSPASSEPKLDNWEFYEKIGGKLPLLSKGQIWSLAGAETKITTHPSGAEWRGLDIATAGVPWETEIYIPVRVGRTGADISWGDGTESERGGILLDFERSPRVAIAHTYKNPGSYVARIYINGNAETFTAGTIVLQTSVQVK